MPVLWGKTWKKADLLKHVGDVSAIGGVETATLDDGFARGVRIARVRTGGGFDFTIVIDRGLDISHASFEGVPLAYRSPTGEVAPEFYEPEGLGWLRGFFGGLNATCGTTYHGAPCKDQGKDLGLHGRISYTPARNVHCDGVWKGDEYEIVVEGKLREAAVFGENIQVSRRITARLGEKRLFLHDEIENLGHESQPHMVLYHVNAGFPVASPESEVLAPSVRAMPRDAEAEKEREKWMRFLPPTPGFKERCYFHSLKADRDGQALVAVVNPAFRGGEGIGYYLRFSLRQLPKLCQWKMMGEGLYVMGTEPGNAYPEQRSVLREEKRLEFLKPGEKRTYDLEIGVLSGKEEIEGARKAVKKALGK
jgi:hypothetical protein